MNPLIVRVRVRMSKLATPPATTSKVSGSIHIGLILIIIIDNSDPSDEEGEEIDEDNEDGVEDDLDESEDELEELSINDALSNSLFGEYPRKRCAICPGRLLTVEKFGSQHLESKVSRLPPQLHISHYLRRIADVLTDSLPS